MKFDIAHTTQDQNERVRREMAQIEGACCCNCIQEPGEHVVIQFADNQFGLLCDGCWMTYACTLVAEQLGVVGIEAEMDEGLEQHHQEIRSCR